MQEPPLHHLLDGRSGTEQDGRALEGVVRRHRRHRTNRLRVTAASAVIVLGGALTAVGLTESHPSTTFAEGRNSPYTPAQPGRLPPLGTGGPANGSDHGTHGATKYGTAEGGPSSFAAAGSNGGVTYEPAANSTSPVTNPQNGAVSATGAMSASTPLPRFICRSLGCGASHALAGFRDLATTRSGDVAATTYLVTGKPTFVYGFVRSSSFTFPDNSISTCARHRELIVRVTVGGRALGLVVAPETSTKFPIHSVSEATLADANGKPLVVAVASVGRRVRSVEAGFSDGTHITASPRHGTVVLIDRPATEKAAMRASVTLTVHGRGGATLASTRVAYPYYVGIAADSECILG